ncbi:ABC-2 type transport system ATP-binding protein [Sphingomonas sp. UYAg733]
MTALLLEHVTKSFGTNVAVSDLSFSVNEGEVFGFLGGNGAGKTTSLRMVLDIIRPSSGRLTVLGKPPGRENRADLGFLPEERGLYRSMSALDTVTYFGRLKSMSASAARSEARAILDRFGLDSSSKIGVDKLSKGMAQKVQIATAIVNRPRLLMLDEPFSGLDPINQELLEQVILDMSRAGATVIFSTHIMQHAERLCDRLVLLDRGHKVFEGTQAEARGRMPVRLTLTSRDTPAVLADVAGAEPEGPALDGWTDWVVVLAPGVEPGAVLEECTARGFALRRFEHHRPSLHDVFIQLVRPGDARQ